MMKKILFSPIAILVSAMSWGQTVIGTGADALDANPDVLLELRAPFSNPTGFLMPSATFDQINSNLFPRIDNTINTSFNNNGMLIYASDSSKFMYFRDDYNAFALLNPWTLSANGSVLSFASPSLLGFGLGTHSPVSFLDVAGGVAVGSGFAGNDAAPADGLLVEGKTVIGTSMIDPDPNVKLQVEGDVSIKDDMEASGILVINATISDKLNVEDSIKVTNGIEVNGGGIAISSSSNYAYSEPKQKQFFLQFNSFTVSTGSWLYRGNIMSTLNTGKVVASINLPTGAIVSRVTGYLHDVHSQGLINCFFRSLAIGETFPINNLVSIGTTSPFNNGGIHEFSRSANFTVSKDNYYFCECESTMSNNSQTVGIQGFLIEYSVTEIE